MKDMLGQNVQAGDIFIIPSGNPRYGGLIIEVGIVLSMTDKRLKTLITKFDKIKLVPTTKTSKKILKISEFHHEESYEGLLSHEAVQKLKATFICGVEAGRK